jgi:hypothetical protein
MGIAVQQEERKQQHTYGRHDAVDVSILLDHAVTAAYAAKRLATAAVCLDNAVQALRGPVNIRFMMHIIKRTYDV